MIKRDAIKIERKAWSCHEVPGRAWAADRKMRKKKVLRNAGIA